MAGALHIDFEAGSPGDLKKQGVYRWVEHPATQCWCMSWRLDNGPVHNWRPADADPQPVLDHVSSGGRVVAHNAAFEYVFWNRVVRARLRPHWPELRIEQMDCTMARALALALPASLDLLGSVLALPQKKDTAGAKVMKEMARPFKTLVTPSGTQHFWLDDEPRRERLGAYCDGDVLTECAADAMLLPLSDTERDVWLLDQRINERGIMLDVPAIHKALAIVEQAKRALDAEMAEITDGAVKNCTQAKALAEWITTQGVPCTSVAKSEHDELVLLGQILDAPKIERALEIRRLGGKSSTAKLETMLACVCKDGRARGQLQYHGASTGRWAGRLIQPQNLPRVDDEVDAGPVAAAIEILHRDVPAATAMDLIATISGEPVEIAAKCLRSMFIAAPGHRFIGGDLSNIEGCVNAWLSGEQWKVDAYAARQRGEGPDLYRVAYARSFGGSPESVRGTRRQIGKVQELAFGYQGAVGSFLSMGKVYRVRPADIVATVRDATDDAVWEAACKRYHRARSAECFGLPVHEWAAVRVTVDKWREAHPNITQGWWDLQDAAIEAVANPGSIVAAFDGRIRYLASRGFLWCALPSGRLLAYCRPRIAAVDDSTLTSPDGQLTLKIDEVDPDLVTGMVADGWTLKEKRRRAVLYEGYSGERKAWTVHQLYGGLQCENCVQAIARDVMVHGMQGAEKRGYPIVLTVHDELLCEVPIGHGTKEELQQIMATVPDWASGLPLAAKTWEDTRYSK